MVAAGEISYSHRLKNRADVTVSFLLSLASVFLAYVLQTPVTAFEAPNLSMDTQLVYT